MMERVRDSLTQISQISRLFIYFFVYLLLLFNSYVDDICIRERERETPSQLLMYSIMPHFKLRATDYFTSFLSAYSILISYLIRSLSAYLKPKTMLKINK